MLTVAHLIDDIAIGGINRALKDQCEALKDKFAFSTIALNPRRPLPPLVPHDVAIVNLSVSWSKMPFLTLLRAQRGARPVVIVEHTYTRGFERNCVPHSGRFRTMLRTAYRLADMVVAVSHGQAEWLLAAEVVPPDKLVVIQTSVDCGSLTGLPVPDRRPGGPLRLLAYGRYCRQKAFETAVEAMRLLPPGLATLTLAGYGEDEPALKAKAAQVHGVTVGPTVSDLPSLLAAHDIVVMPSRWEAFGLVCLEARAAGRPVLVSHVDGLVEQTNDSYGRLVAPDDPSALANAILDAASWDLAQMGAAARASVGKHYEAYLEGTSQLLHDVALRGSASPHRRRVRGSVKALEAS